MAGGFKVKCPECGHEWEGIQVSCTIGHLSRIEKGNRLELFCPKCVLVASYPRMVDRNSWKKWQDELKRDKRVLALTRSISDKIEVQVASAKSPYVPISLNLSGVVCPLCAHEMNQLDHGEQWWIVCPACQKQSTLLTEFESIISLVPIMDEFG